MTEIIRRNSKGIEVPISIEFHVIPAMKAEVCIKCHFCTKTLTSTVAQCCRGMEQKVAPRNIDKIEACDLWPSLITKFKEVWFSIEEHEKEE